MFASRVRRRHLARCQPPPHVHQRRSVASPGARLSASAFAILGLLASSPRSGYELAREMDQTLRFIWPRASSKLFDVPKLLVARRLAQARQPRLSWKRKRSYVSGSDSSQQGLSDQGDRRRPATDGGHTAARCCDRPRAAKFERAAQIVRACLAENPGRALHYSGVRPKRRRPAALVIRIAWSHSCRTVVMRSPRPESR